MWGLVLSTHNMFSWRNKRAIMALNRSPDPFCTNEMVGNIRQNRGSEQFWKAVTSMKLISLKTWPPEFSRGFCMIDVAIYFLTPHDLISDLTKILTRTSFWASLKMCSLVFTRVFLWFDLVTYFSTLYDPLWGQKFVNILRKFQLD